MTWQSLQVVAAANAGLQFVSLKLGYLLLTFISRESAPTGFNNRCLERFGADGLKSPKKQFCYGFVKAAFLIYGQALCPGNPQTGPGNPEINPEDTGAGRTERSVSMASKLT